MFIVAASGHRPDKLGGYSTAIENELRSLAHRVLIEVEPDWVITGMALGWDQAVASAAALAGIPFTAAIPFQGQELKWPERARQVYCELLREASHVEYVSAPGFAAWKMQKRNEWMVDHAQEIEALWDGSRGGTANCLAYAFEQKVRINNHWTAWQERG